jgi:hypothetical protein
MTARTRSTHRLLVCVLLLLLLAPLSAAADTLDLRRVITDENGDFTVFFSVVRDSGEPIADPAQLPIESITLQAGSDPVELSALALSSPSLTTLDAEPIPFQIVMLLPDTDLFNGMGDDPARPDAVGLRRAVTQALVVLPERADVTLRVGLYNDRVRWLDPYSTLQLDELSAALMGPEAASPPGTRMEDPFSAISIAYRTILRRQARDRESQDQIHFLLVVTSAMTPVDSEEFNREIQRVNGLLVDRSMQDVVTQVIVYFPFVDDEYLLSPENEPYRFATGVTPPNGSYRLASNLSAIRRAMQQTVDEIDSTMVLRFNNTELEDESNYHFQLTLTPEGGAELQSNRLLGHVAYRDNPFPW